jgi:hypothetical protein
MQYNKLFVRLCILSSFVSRTVKKPQRSTRQNEKKMADEESVCENVVLLLFWDDAATRLVPTLLLRRQDAKAGTWQTEVPVKLTQREEQKKTILLILGYMGS